jgi:hypothetical protein
VDRASREEEAGRISSTGQHGDEDTFEDEPPDRPSGEDEPVTPNEQRRASLERRLRMEELEEGSRRLRRRDDPIGRAIVDDDRLPEDVALEDPEVPAEEAELDRTPQEVGERSAEPATSAEEAAVHIEQEPD